MKRLFLTTSIAAVAVMSAGFAHGQSAQVLSSADYVKVNDAVKTSSHALGLHTGDFQINARLAKSNAMYRGEGASLMITVMLQRD